MGHLKTCPASAPPPPIPPVPRAPAAAADPSPDPPRSPAWSQATALRGAEWSFLRDVVLDLRHVVWPSPHQVCSETLIAIGLLGFCACYISVLTYIIPIVLHFIGL